MAADWVSRMIEDDASRSAKVAQELSMTTNKIVNFHDLPAETQEYLNNKYEFPMGEEVMSVIGPRYCFNGLCGCRVYTSGYSAPTGPPCARIFRSDLKTGKYIFINNLFISAWSEGDPLFIVVEDGQIKKVEY